MSESVVRPQSISELLEVDVAVIEQGHSSLGRGDRIRDDVLD